MQTYHLSVFIILRFQHWETFIHSTAVIVYPVQGYDGSDNTGHRVGERSHESLVSRDIQLVFIYF